MLFVVWTEWSTHVSLSVRRLWVARCAPPPPTSPAGTTPTTHRKATPQHVYQTKPIVIPLIYTQHFFHPHPFLSSFSFLNAFLYPRPPHLSLPLFLSSPLSSASSSISSPSRVSLNFLFSLVLSSFFFFFSFSRTNPTSPWSHAIALYKIRLKSLKHIKSYILEV